MNATNIDDGNMCVWQISNSNRRLRLGFFRAYRTCVCEGEMRSVEPKIVYAQI